MRAMVDIDRDLEREISEAQALIKEKQATVIRLALRAGLPLLVDRFQAPRPEGYFDSDYKDSKRCEFEKKMSRVKQRPER
jgi:hypothetical protein